jgi:serine carboxypeptidase-like clade 4
MSDFILNSAEKQIGRTINPYNIKLTCPVPGCFDMNNITHFLNSPEIRKDLGVDDHHWQMCSDTVARHLINDEVLNFKYAVSMILAAQKRVLIYSGKLDYVCNYFGGRAWTASMKWSGQDQFNQAKYRDWIVDGSVAGQVKDYELLTLLEINDAGHQVPMFVPKQALDLFNRFINNKPF